MHCIIITRKLSKNEINKIINFAKVESCQIYSYTKHKEFLSNSLNNTVNYNIEEESVSYINTLGHEMIGSKTLNEWLKNDNSSFWYYLRFTMFFIHLNRQKEYNLITSVDISLFNRKTVFSNHNFEDTIPSINFITTKHNGSSFNLSTILKFVSLFLWRSSIGLLQHIFIPGNKNVIGLEPYNRNKILDINSKDKINYVNSDHYNHYLSEEAHHNYDFSFLSDFYHPDFKKEFELHKNYFIPKYISKTQFFEFYEVLTLLNPLKMKKILSIKKQLKNSPLAFSDVYLHRVISKKGNLLMFMALREEAAKLFFKSKKNTSFTCHHEQSYHHQSIINGAKKTKIPSIGFQHGTIHRLHIHYIYTPLDIKYNPIPDFMFTWGEHWKNILTKNSIYPLESTYSLGQIRTDAIPYLQNNKSTNKKTRVLLASQTDQIGVNNRIKVATNFLKLTKDFPEVEFIIKPHPYEKQPELFFNSIAEGIGTKNFSITYDDLYIVLNKIDALITFHSTVASEAIYFKKPVIICNYENNDRDNYLKYRGATFEAKNYKMLQNIIKDLEKNTLDISSKTQNQFINEFSNVIDGKIAKRYLKTIQKIVAKNNN